MGVGIGKLGVASGRVDLLKWCFLFWVGQVLAIGGLLAVMLRLTYPSSPATRAGSTT